MATDVWPTKRFSVTSLHLDKKNPRLGRESSGRAPREIIQYLFEHDKAMEVAESIALRGYFPNEPLLAIKEEGRYVVVEGNRRLAALKALREPGVLEGSQQRRVEALSRRIADLEDIATVPVTIAPSRRATDRQIAGRHIGSPVLAWDAAWVLTYDDCPEIRQMYEAWATIRPFGLRYTASARRSGQEVLIVPKSLQLPSSQESSALSW
jgi:hypothetical protein